MNSTSMKIAEGDRVYATETINYGYDGTVPRSTEGTVERFIDHDGCPLIIEWDTGFAGAAASESIALVPPLAR